MQNMLNTDQNSLDASNKQKTGLSSQVVLENFIVILWLW